jgi:hypothetical protein
MTTSKTCKRESVVSDRLQSLLNNHYVARITRLSLALVRRWRLMRQRPKCLKVGAAVRYIPESIRKFLATRPSGGRNQEGGAINQEGGAIMQTLQTGLNLPQSLSVVAREYLDGPGSLCTYDARHPDEWGPYACLRILPEVPSGPRRRGLHAPPLGERG